MDCRKEHHQISSFHFSHSVVFDSLQPHESQHTRPPCVYREYIIIESVMPSSHLTLCRPLLLLPPIPPSIRVFSNESSLRMRWPKYSSFSFIQSKVIQKEKNRYHKLTPMWDLEKWCRWTYLQRKNKNTDVENKHMDTKRGIRSGMNWEIGMDIHTLLCVKSTSLVTQTVKNLPAMRETQIRYLDWEHK